VPRFRPATPLESLAQGSVAGDDSHQEGGGLARLFFDMDHFDIAIAGLERTLPVREIEPGVRIALFDLRGDVELCAVLASSFVSAGFPVCDVVATIEAKAVPLAHEVSKLLDRPYVVLSKSRRKYMLNPLSAPVRSFTAQAPERLWLDSHQADLVRGRDVWLLDDVVTTGNTLRAAETLFEQAGAHVTRKMVVFKEGTTAQSMPGIYAIGELPLFAEEV